MADDKNKDIKLTWRFSCRDCKSEFEVEVPRGPREERELRCPSCEGQNIEKMEPASAQNGPSCGG